MCYFWGVDDLYFVEFIEGGFGMSNWVDAFDQLPPVEHEVLLEVKNIFVYGLETRVYTFYVVGVYEDGELTKSDSQYNWEDWEDTPIPEGWYACNHFTNKYYHDSLIPIKATEVKQTTEVVRWMSLSNIK